MRLRGHGIALASFLFALSLALSTSPAPALASANPVIFGTNGCLNILGIYICIDSGGAPSGIPSAAGGVACPNWAGLWNTDYGLCR
jgi:hypothetical protein